MEQFEDAEKIVSAFFRLKDCLRRYRQTASGIDRKFIILGSLREYETMHGRPVTMTEIARTTGIALPNVSRMLAPLEREGYIVRRKNGRTVSVVTTVRAEEELQKQWLVLLQEINEALGPLDEGTKQSFLDGLNCIVEGFEAIIKKRREKANA